MTGQEWKPGDVAMVTWRRRRTTDPSVEVVAVRDESDDWFAPSDRVTIDGDAPARPLVVIDPEDNEVAQRIAAYIGRNDIWRLVREGLASLLRPETPDEPTGLGAVVEDEKGARWVRGSGDPCTSDGESPFAVWRRDNGLTGTPPVSYRDIAVVRVLSEGVPL